MTTPDRAPEDRAQPRKEEERRAFPPRLLATGGVTVFTAAASWYLISGTRAVECDSLAPLTILATVAAFIIAICFRQMGQFTSKTTRGFLATCLLLAAATVFANFRFVRHNRGFCDQLQQQMHHPMH